MKAHAPRIAALSFALALAAAPALAHSPAEHQAMAATADEHAGHADHTGHAGHGAAPAAAPADHAGHGAAMNHGDHQSRAVTLPPAASVPVKLSGKPLLDQDGRSVLLKKDVIGERVAVVTIVYTSCTTVCPMVSAIMADLQAKLGDRLDKDVRLVSLTVDPANDTPERLKNYSSFYDAKPGWFWLTGQSANVNDALKGFGAYTPDYENHPIIVMIGDGKSGKWSRHYGLSKAETLLARVDAYLATRKPATPNKAAAIAAAPKG